MAGIATPLEHLEHILTEVLTNEWEAQGHHMSGKIVKDIEYKAKQETSRIILSGFMYPYGNIIAAGVKPSKIPFGGTAKRGQGTGGTSLYIKALQNYARQRMGIEDEKKALGVAFAIAKTQKKEGMPTRGSYTFSTTGKRLDWVEEAFKKNEDRIVEAIREFGYNVLSAEFDVLINKWQTEINKSA